jgi:hypothetical protein
VRGRRASLWATGLAALLAASIAHADDAPPSPSASAEAPPAARSAAPVAPTATPTAEPAPPAVHDPKAEPGDAAPPTLEPGRVDAPAKAAPPAKRTMRRVRKTARIETHARDLRLDAEAMDRLERIAQRYYEKTKKRLIVTGGMRHPEVQAKLMYEKLRNGDDLLKLYEQTAAAREIQRAYRDGIAKRLSRSAAVRNIKHVIEAQLARGVYVSKHLSAVAADVRSRGMSPTQERALRAAVAAEPGVEIVDERGSASPHFHLDLLGTPPGPPPRDK